MYGPKDMGNLICHTTLKVGHKKGDKELGHTKCDQILNILNSIFLNCTTLNIENYKCNKVNR